MSEQRGIFFGLGIAVLAIGGVSYAYYSKLTNYVPVQGHIVEMRKICYRLDKSHEDKPVSNAINFLPMDERPCPEVRFGFDRRRGDRYLVARFTLFKIDYISPVDGQQHRTSFHQKEDISHNRLKPGQAIAMRAHKKKADEALFDHFMDENAG
jgi:hypothetical protein